MTTPSGILMPMCVQADDIAAMISDSLVEEVETTPKPGLVDLASSGSHDDLSVGLFLTSASALRPYFKRFVQLGMSHDDPLPLCFPSVRSLGKEAESAMFAATHGVNTHKGALFSLGILATVTGYAIRRGIPLDADTVCFLAAYMTKDTLDKEYRLMELREPSSHGEMVVHRYGRHAGIREEVRNGFPSVRRYGLPACKQMPSLSADDARLQILLSLMAHVEDSNVLHRGGPEGLRYVKATAKGLLSEGGVGSKDVKKKLERLDTAFIARNLSCGGSADLLSVTLYLSRLQQCQHQMKW